MSYGVYPWMVQQSLVIGTALGQTFTGKANQAGLVLAFGKSQRAASVYSQ